MKILVLSNLYPPDALGGCEIACARMVDALGRRGHDVRVLASAPRFPVPEAPGVLRRFQLAEEASWAADDLWAHPLGKRLRDVKSRFINAHNVHVLTTALEEFEPDVLYLWNLVGLGGLAVIACLGYLGVPWVWQLGDDVPGTLCGLSDGTVPELAEEFSRQVRGHYIVDSRRLLEQVEASGVILRGDVEVLLEPIARRAEAAAWPDSHIDAVAPRIERTLAAAARRPRAVGGTSAEAYRLARLAEQLAMALVEESPGARGEAPLNHDRQRQRDRSGAGVR